MNNRSHHRPFRSRSFRNAFEAMEQRQHFSANSVKAIDSGGPDFSYVESKGTIYVLSSTASGAGQNQIWSSTGGGTGNSKLLVNTNAAGSKISSLDDLVTTTDGTIYFTATTTGGRQIFKLASNGYSQLTSGSNVFYNNLTVVGSKLFFTEDTGEKICTFNSNGSVNAFVSADPSKMFAAKDQLFYFAGTDGGLYHTDGTSANTGRVDSGVVASQSRVFESTDWLYFCATVSNQQNLYRTDGSSVTPELVAEDFDVSTGVPVAQVGADVYFSGSYYNTSPNAHGSQLYKVSNDGTVTAVTTLSQANGGARPEGVAAIGDNIYFSANDGDYLNSEGTYDRELWRYNVVSGTTTKVTTQETLVPAEIGTGVLTNYYFVAAPEKVGSRFGSRKLYRTNPTDDTIEEVSGLPSYTDSNGNTKEDISMVFGSSKGLFYSARNNDGTGGDFDSYFVATPFTYIDPVSHNLIVEGTDNSDRVEVKMSGGNVVITLNGTSETRDPTTFGNMVINLKGGDDKLVTTADVTTNMDVHGDTGNDTMLSGSGNDSIAGGSGKNYYYGGNGRDRLRGSNGFDYMEGGDGNDRLYGRGGNDNLHGNTGADYIYGDDPTGPFGNDQLFGESNNDKLYGYGGDDVFFGGKQNDSLFGGDGNDTMYGQDGNDTLDGEAGEDSYFGDDGDDLLLSADGSLDILNGGAGTDTATRDTNEKAIDLIEL